MDLLTIVDQHTQECSALEPAHSLTVAKVVHVLDAIALDQGHPESITAESLAVVFWMAGLTTHGVKLNFIKPGKPVDNGYYREL